MELSYFILCLTAFLSGQECSSSFNYRKNFQWKSKRDQVDLTNINKRFLNWNTVKSVRLKRQVQYHINGMQHVYGDPPHPLHFPPFAPRHVYQESSFERSNPSFDPHALLPQQPRLSPQLQEFAAANADNTHNTETMDNISPMEQRIHGDSYLANTGGNEGPTAEESQPPRSAEDVSPDNIEKLHDHMVKDFSSESEHIIGDMSPPNSDSNQNVVDVLPPDARVANPEGPVAPPGPQVADVEGPIGQDMENPGGLSRTLAPNVGSPEVATVNSGAPLNIRIVKKFYPVEIVQKVPKPIPVMHVKLVPVPVHQKRLQYVPQPYAQPFQRTPDVRLSFIHLDKRANPCQHGGIIVQGPGGYTCLCRKAYKGKHCQERDRCYPHPCQNNGDCIDHGTHYECRCTKGFKGINCDVEDKCYNHPCKNGGSCVQLTSGIKCVCSPGYKGQFCQDIDHCSPNPCRNKGTCHELNQDASCTCTSSFKGPRCQVRRTCSANLCRNGGTCREDKPSLPCQCVAGFTGDYCTENVCQPNPCQNEGICYPSRSDYNTTWYAACKCRDTFKGESCQILNPCASNPSPCVHGICYDRYTNIEQVDLSAEGFTCRCYEGYFGTYCREKKCDHCDINARCMDGFRCTCNEGYHGDGHSCRKIPDPCAPNPCENGGTCRSDQANFECKCRLDFRGKTCREKKPCSSLNNPCKNGGTCIEDGAGYHCICLPERRGKHCSDNSTSLCNRQPCLNGGTCKVSEDNKNWYCVCRGTPFRPPDCACNCPANARDHSERNFTCDNPEGICTCPQGFTHDVNHDVCVDEEDIGPGKTAISCTPNPCKNGGSCTILTRSRLVCLCPEGWTGKLCDKKVKLLCEPNPCKNGGNCSVVKGQPVCTCPEGFQPPFCEHKGRSRCLPNPCHNNGRCNIVGNSYDCVCDPQFTGPNCEVDRCLKCDPVNALCTNGKCFCKPGYIGNGYQCFHGQKVVKVCAKCHPVHAVCVDDNCQCKDGYVGNGYQCQEFHPSGGSGTLSNQDVPWFKRTFNYSLTAP